MKTLNIIHQQTQKNMILSRGTTIKIPAQAHTIYQILDEFGGLMVQPHSQKVGQDLWIFLDNDYQNNQPSLILEKYYDFSVIQNGNQLSDLNASFALSGHSSTVPTPAATGDVGMGGGAILAGLVGIAGIGAAIASGGKGKKDKSPSNTNDYRPIETTPTTTSPTPNSSVKPSPKPPKITFNPITEDNIINLEESRQTAIEISGKVEHFIQGNQLNIQIGQAKPIRVSVKNDGTFSFFVDGKTLANHTKIQASLTTQDATGKTQTVSQTADYQVDVIAPTPSITLNQIAGDNIINKTESEQATTAITGSVSGLEQGNQVMLVCTCKSCSSPTRTVEIPVTIQQDNTFKFNMNTADLLKYDTITAKVQSQDKAKNIGTNEATQTYRQDLVLNPPEITIDNIENVNRNKWLKNDFRISGSLKTDEDVPNQQAQITVKINGQVFAERVAHNGKNWTLSISQNQLEQWDKQTLNVDAEIAVRDTAGNTHSATSERKTFQVSIAAPELSIDLNPIGRISPDQDLTVSGKVSGKFKPNDTVSLEIGSHRVDGIALDTQGAFTAQIAQTHLQGQNSVWVKIVSRDDLGNETTAQDRETYTFPSSQDIVLHFNHITGDNHINVTEKSQLLTVSGYLMGKYADTQKGKSVSMNVNGKNLTAIVKDDLRFEFKVQGEDLLQHKGYTLSGSLNDNGRTVSAHKNYTVAPDAIAKIHLNDVNLGLAEEIGSVRLSGRLDFANSDSVYKLGYNKDFVRSITLKIGNQEFNIGIEKSNDTFFLDLTHEQYQALKGQNIGYELKAYNGEFYNWLPVFDDKATHNDRWVGIAINGDDYAKTELSKVQVIFDDANIQNTQQLQFDIDNKTEISGHVVGAKAGDEIALQIGGQNYRTTVRNDLSFKTLVLNENLKQSSTIQATLNTQNGKNENIVVSDSAVVLNAVDVGSQFVNPHKHVEIKDRVIQHSDPNYNFAYFIHANTPYGKHTGGFLSKLLSVKNGGEPVTLKYYFVTQEDYDSGRYQPTHLERETWSPYSEAHKEVVRDIYRQIANATNIKFIETQIEAEKDTFFMKGNHVNKGVDGTAGYGSGVAVNAYEANNDFYKSALIHEIMHTFGTDHIWDTLSKLDYGKNEVLGELSNMAGAGKDGLLRVFDLAYLHYRFGVNPNHHSGNDVYHFQTYTDKTSEAGVYIWDGGGVDTFDASKEKEGVTVNLTPGSWIYRGEKSDSFIVKDRIKIKDLGEMNKYFPEYPDVNFIGNTQFTYSKTIYAEGQAFIGYGTQIENLIGSAHADVLKGNKADNNIYGSDGNDQIWGDDGNDYLDGGKGTDILHGGLGNDIFVVDNVGDKVIEKQNEGTDTVYAHVNYRLSDFVENLSLFGNAMTGEGNALNNIIQGNDENNTLRGEAGNDQLDGGRGSDTLTGGDGADTFVFSALLDGAVDTITDFTLSEDKIELALNVFAGLTVGNLAEHIKYDQATGALSYDADGAGNADAIHFATLQNKVDLKMDETHFILA